MNKKFIKRDGYIVMTPNDVSDPTPLICPICKLVMSSRDDLISYSKLECCNWCERMWTQGDRRARWHDGWRPNPEHVKATLRGLGLLDIT